MRRLQGQALLIPLGTWRHLAFRFFDFVTSRSLSTEERAEIDSWLRPSERAAFFAQGVADQRHGLVAARFVAVTAPGRTDLARAALLHDLGKRHSRLGAVARSLVTGWVKLGGAARGRGVIYLGHGDLGAEELAAMGCEDLVVDFARHHHSTRPETISELDWELLSAADKARFQLGSRKSAEAGR